MTPLERLRARRESTLSQLRDAAPAAAPSPSSEPLAGARPDLPYIPHELDFDRVVSELPLIDAKDVEALEGKLTDVGATLEWIVPPEEAGHFAEPGSEATLRTGAKPTVAQPGDPDADPDAAPSPLLRYDKRDVASVLGVPGVARNQTFDGFLDSMVELSGSDLTLTTGQVPAVRVGTEVLAYNVPPVPAALMDAFLNVVLTEEEQQRIVEETTRRASRVQMSANGKMSPFHKVYLSGANRYRTTISMCAAGTTMAIRLLPSRIMKLYDLGVPDILFEALKNQSGAILFAGPTGSGKTTLLAAVNLGIGMAEAKKIVTIESPIEYLYPSTFPAGCPSIFIQKEVGRDVLSFADGAEAVLRENPNVVTFGEILDADIAREAINIANTGHVVTATLHANSAIQIPFRMAQFFDIANRAAILAQAAEAIKLMVFVRKVPAILRKGEYPAAFAYEVIPMTTKIRDALVSGDQKQLANYAVDAERDAGGQTLGTALIRLVEQNRIERETAIRNCHEYERDDVVRQLNGL